MDLYELCYTCIFWYLCPSVYFLLSSWKNVRKAALDSTQNRGYQRPVYKVYSYIHVKIKCTCQDSYIQDRTCYWKHMTQIQLCTELYMAVAMLVTSKIMCCISCQRKESMYTNLQCKVSYKTSYGWARPHSISQLWVGSDVVLHSGHQIN